MKHIVEIVTFLLIAKRFVRLASEYVEDKVLPIACWIHK